MKNKEIPTASYGMGLVLSDSIVQNLEGQLLTLIEALGLKESQEKSTKDILRNTLWRTIGDNCVYIGTQTHNAIREAKEKARSENKTPYGEVEIV